MQSLNLLVFSRCIRWLKASVYALMLFVATTGCGKFDSNPLLPFPADIAMGFKVSKYANHRAYEDELRRLASTYPRQFGYHSDRRSYDAGYPLYWITVGDTSKPSVFFVSVLHAKNEWAGAELVLKFAEKLLDPEDNQREFNRAFLSKFSFVAVPMANPWGYFSAPDGKHYNAHSAMVPNIESADWHDMSNYARYEGVNLNRNFDWNWSRYQNLPWSVRSYWNGTDYGFANYFMAPYYRDAQGNDVYAPTGDYSNRVLRPDPEIYDYKGKSPFSEPETQLLRDLVTKRYRVIGFADWHIMNPWQTNNASYISGHDPERVEARKLIDDGIRRVNARNSQIGGLIPECKHIVMEEYDSNAPYSINWAQNAVNIRSFGWETGTQLPDEVWTDAYLEMFYRSIFWFVNGGGHTPLHRGRDRD